MFKRLSAYALALALLVTPVALGAQQIFDRGSLLQDAATATGNGQNLDVSQYQSIAIQIISAIGAWVITPEGSLDAGTTWNTLTCYPLGSSTTTTALSAKDIFRCNTLGIPLVRTRISTAGTGTMSVRVYPSKFAFSIGTLTP